MTALNFFETDLAAATRGDCTRLILLKIFDLLSVQHARCRRAASNSTALFTRFMRTNDSKTKKANKTRSSSQTSTQHTQHIFGHHVSHATMQLL
jgi:hypothetical protein